jgi:CBS domain-containing protein
MEIRELMTRDVECIPADATLRDAANRMEALNVGSLPVCDRDRDRLIGMVTDRDITIRSFADGRDPREKNVREAMTPKVVSCFEDQDVGEAIRVMNENQIRRLPILNRHKRLVGIVSLGDVAVEIGDKQLIGKVLERISEPAMATA